MYAGRRGAAQMRAKIQKLGEAGSGGAPRYARATAASCSSAHVTCEKSKKRVPKHVAAAAAAALPRSRGCDDLRAG
jgi:hypothetical protein